MDELTPFTIINGKIHDETYPHDFHVFQDERTVKIVVLVPGIIDSSVLVNIRERQLRLTMRVSKRFYSIYKFKVLRVEGELPMDVHDKTMVAEYIDGVLEIQLAKKLPSS